MAIARFGRQVKRSYQSYGFGVKLAVAVILGLCFVVIWSVFSPPAYSVTSQRDTFDDIAEPISAEPRNAQIHPNRIQPKKVEDTIKLQSPSIMKERNRNKFKGSVPIKSGEKRAHDKRGGEISKLPKRQHDKEETAEEQKADELVEGDSDLVDYEQEATEELEEDEDDDMGSGVSKKRKRERMGPLFDPKAHYTWKLCGTRSKHNYIPCIDMEASSARLQSYRHHERSCPRTPVMCLVPLPPDGYTTPVSWPKSKFKVLYKNVAHPKLASFVKTSSWVVQSAEYLTFPHNQSVFKGGTKHYLDSIEEMVPDIEWGKNIRTVLDIGCTDSSFGASLLERDVLTLTLGLKDDLVDLAQVALERGFPAIVSPFASRRLPFPSGVFDAIHCGECHISWHSYGGRLLLEMNRILRPGGYFILSTEHDSIEVEEALSKVTASICWNILAHKTDEVNDVGVKIYQKPESNDIYELKRKKISPLCKEKENPDDTWYVPIKACLHAIPAALEQRGAEWPEDWPQRLETFPEWMGNNERLLKDSEHWNSVVNKSYLIGMGIDWSNIRNVMDMKAIYGGLAAALLQQKVWVMNVVPIHAPDTLPVIFERGLVGVYHDWCESFGTYPRSYDLLHADHLFSRLKSRCKQPTAIVVEMDRILRPSGWAIIRDKVEILDPLEAILRSLRWEIRMTFAKGKEGILCAQKATWRPS